MSNRRIEIIIQEINYWKEHKLLPEVYCDFLLALYTKGENEVETEKANDIGLASIIQLSCQFLLLLFSIIVINMQHINLTFQYIFLPISFLIIFWLFRTLHKNRDIYFQLSTVILLVHFLLITMFLGNQMSDKQWVAHMIIIFNFICWFLIGHKYQLKFLQLIGLILTIISIVFMFF